ncbi:MAG: fibronectin type III domain-containing protein [Acidobacteriota bacterium]
MANRTHHFSRLVLPRRIKSSFARKQNLVAVWMIVAALLVQQSAIARISAAPVPSERSSDSLLKGAGSVFVDSDSDTRIVRVTDERDGRATLTPRVNSSSFNLDSSRFFVDLDGKPTLYTLDPSNLGIQKQGPLFGSIALQSDSCQWSATNPDTVIGLDSTDSTRIYGYDTRSGSYTLLKDFPEILFKGEAGHFSKSWSDDNHFSFALREPGSAWRFVIVWERSTESTYLFDLADPLAGVPSFSTAHLDRSGEALIVSGDIRRVWRYRTQQQLESVQLETTGDSREPEGAFEQNAASDVFTTISSPVNPSRADLSRDGRFSIFSSHTDGSRSDVFIAAVHAAATASSINWTSMVNCSAIANSLQKTGGIDQADDASATSAQAVMSGDANVEFTAEQNDKERWCGLNNSNAIHQSAGDIDFAIKLANNGKAFVVENGVVKAKTKYKPGNVFRVAVESGAVNYYKNGSVFYTSTASPVYPLLVNASLVDAMAAVNNAMIFITTIGTVVSISPATANATAGATSQFTAIVTGSIDTLTWSATAGSVTGTGLYTAPAAPGTYIVKAACSSNPGIGASATVSVTTTADTTAPVISSVSASSVTASGATISWNTDEPSDTQVEYGTDDWFGALSTQNPAMVTGHSVAFGGLNPGALYHYRVMSKDAAGNLAVSSDFTFTTLSGADTTPPVISGVAASGITTNSATITWSTNEASDTQVEFGTTTGYGKSTAVNASLGTSHTALLTGLSANTSYHYRVKSKDASGNLAASGDFTFATSAAPPPPPPSSGVVTDHNVHPEPQAPALPRAGGTFIDPTFGTTIMRVTDENDGTSNYSYYSYWPTFNLDSTRFFIACDGNPKLYRFDPNNFQIVSKGPLFDQPLPGGGFMSTEDAEWSGTNPNVLYGYHELKLWAFDVSARTYTMVKDFASELPPGNLGQMSRSLDDNVFAFTKKDTNYHPTGYIVWRRDQNRVLRNVTLGNFDEVELDKTGRYLVVKAEFGGGVDFQVVDFDTANLQALTDSTPDYSPGHSDNGRQMVVGHDNWNNQYTVRTLASPRQFQKVITFGNDWSQSNHLSMLADNEGWCVISNFTSGTGPLGPFRQEIFQASTDGSQNVRRLAHHRSVYRDYWDTPRANISRDGRFVAFTSNWGSAVRRDVFIIRVPQGSGSGPGDTTPPVISGVGASSLTSSSAVISWNTNEGSDTQVQYGTTASYGSGTSLSTAMVTSHSATVAGLSANTLYHYRARSKDAAGNLAVSGDFSFTTPASGVGSGGFTQSVAWSNVVNCTVSGSSLLKTAGLDDEDDAGAVSQQQILSGDGYFEFTAGSTGQIRFCGLTHTVLDTQYPAIDFAIKLTDFGVAEVRENNVYQSETTYTGSDVFRMAIVGGVVKYSKNGTVFYSSSKAPTYPLRVDAVILDLGGTVNSAVISAATAGSLAVTSRKDRSGDVAKGFVAAKDLWVDITREWNLGVRLAPRFAGVSHLAKIQFTAEGSPV